MATSGKIDHHNDANKEEKVAKNVSETLQKQKVLPPPFIIYAETNEECVIGDEDPIDIVKTESDQVSGARKGKRRNRKNRHRTKKGIKQELDNLDNLVLPEGVILVEDGTYIGFQCTYCSCVMSSLKTVEEHTGGNQHKQKIRSKATKGEETTASANSTSQSVPVTLKDDVASSNLSSSTISIVPSGQTSLLASQSSLNKFLLKTKEPVVGLDHIVEVQLAGVPPTFRCNICILDCDADGIKEHIIGTRHRLSYLRNMDTQKIAEMLALNLKKAERNKRTIKYIEDLHTTYGPGTIQITNTPLPPITVAIQTETKASAQPQAAVQPGINPPIIIWDKPGAENSGNDAFNPVSNTLAMRRRRRRKVLAERKRMAKNTSELNNSQEESLNQNNQSLAPGMAQKRPSDGGYPPWKRQSMGRGFQDRKRFGNRQKQGNYFDRRSSSYRDREFNNRGQYQEGRPMNREQYGNKPIEKSDQHMDREPHMEQDGNKPFETCDQNIGREPSKEQDGNKLYERSDQHLNREQYENKSHERRGHFGEQYRNKPFDRHDQRMARERNRERGDNWRSYSGDSIPSRPQTDHHTASPSKHEKYLEKPSNNEDLRNNICNPMDQTRNEPLDMQSILPPPPPPPSLLGPDINFLPNYQEIGDQSNMRGRGRGNRFNSRNRGSFSRSTSNRFSNSSRFETSVSPGFRRFGDFGQRSSFRGLLSDPLSNERDRLKMKYPGLRLGH